MFWASVHKIQRYLNARVEYVGMCAQANVRNLLIPWNITLKKTQ